MSESRNWFAHPQAIVETAAIGARTRIWAFAHVLPGARIGADCNICDHVFIENDVLIGDGVTIKSGVQLWDGVRLHDDVFVGPNVTFSNDPFPRSGKRPANFSATDVRRGASIGANATILPGLTIGQNSMIGAGAVVMADVPPNAIVVGNPAQIKGYVDARVPTRVDQQVTPPTVEPKTVLSVRGAVLHQLPRHVDLRGSLAVAETGSTLPFTPQRYFLVYAVPSREVRGAHAHRELHQFLTCVRGECAVLLDDGQRREMVMLDSPHVGLHIPPMVWGVQFRFSADAMLLVLASAAYDAGDYIRDYDQFVNLVNDDAMKTRSSQGTE